MFIRGNGGKGRIYYFQLKDPVTGAYTTARSTRTAIKKQAVSIAKHEAMLRDAENCNTHISSKMSLISFVELFYDESRSPWLLEKRERNVSALQSDHVRALRSYFERYLKKHINREMTLNDVSPLWLGQLQRTLRSKNPCLMPQTVNAIFTSLLKPLRYATQQWIIPKDPTEGLIPYAPQRKITGSFSETEVKELITHDWDSEVGKLAFLLAIHTGMREGEILALKKGDLEYLKDGANGVHIVNISHSWSKTHGLKCPKNGKSRVVPIPVSLWNQLHAQMGENANDDDFVFGSSRAGKPMSAKLPRAALSRSLEMIGVTLEQQGSRNLRFHSTRHYFNSIMASRIRNETLRKVIGHGSSEMTAYYFHASVTELRMVQDAQNEAFSIIPSSIEEAIA